MMGEMENIEQLNEHQLAEIIHSVGKRMLVLRVEDKDSPFWFDVLMRVNKVLKATPMLNEVEQKLILHSPPEVNGTISAVRSLRERSGMRLRACYDIVEKWKRENAIKSARCKKCSAVFVSGIKVCPSCYAVVS
jgi:hypothetical protein